MRILITGGAGFIGSCMIWELNRLGYDDIIISDNLGNDNYKWKNLYGLKFRDLVDLDECYGDDCDCLIHFGANTDTRETKNDEILKNNYLFSKQLIGWHVRKGNRVIYASSAATYGDGSKGFSDKTNPLQLRPLNMYAMSKNLLDMWIYQNKLQTKVVGLKYFNVFGPNEYHKEFMTSFIYKVFTTYKQTNFTIPLYCSNDKKKFKDGEQVRDFIYVKDAVRATSFFVDKSSQCGIFNVGSGVETTWNTLVDTISEVLGTKLKKEYIIPKNNVFETYQNYTKADLTSLNKVNHEWKPLPLKEAISDYINNYLLLNKTIGE